MRAVFTLLILASLYAASLLAGGTARALDDDAVPSDGGVEAIDHEHAHDHEHVHEPIVVPDAEAHRPSAIPDRILLSWTSDPATTQAVTWRTDDTVTVAYAEIAIATDGPEFDDAPQRFMAATERLETDLGPACYHSYTFTDLAPVTMYAYRVGDGANWSEWIQFTTASAEPMPFTFVYFGDAQNDVKSHWSRVVREAYSDAPRAAFMLHAGDLINHAHNDAEWGEWYYAASHIHRMIPCIATPGNHEYASSEGLVGALGGQRLSDHWRVQFAFPENGPAGLEETCYWIDYQGTRIISLNSNELHQEQVAWLREVLGENPNTWTIITFHHPIYSSSEGRDNAALRELWQPVFDEYRVDLVLQGHDHTYARSGLMEFEQNVATGVTAQSEEGGTVYVVSVSGPKMYDLEREPFMARAAENTQLYQVIHVDGDELRYEARTAVGTPYDAFTLRKREGEVNELIEQVPDTPERIFCD